MEDKGKEGTDTKENEDLSGAGKGVRHRVRQDTVQGSESPRCQIKGHLYLQLLGSFLFYMSLLSIYKMPDSIS